MSEPHRVTMLGFREVAMLVVDFDARAIEVYGGRDMCIEDVYDSGGTFWSTPESRQRARAKSGITQVGFLRGDLIP